MKIIVPVRIDISAGWPDSDPYREDFGGVVLNGAINLYAEASYEGELTTSYGDAKGISGLGASGAVDAAWLVAKNSELLRDKMALTRNVWDLQNRNVGLRGGIQDEAAAIYGGVNLWEFGPGAAVIGSDFSRGVSIRRTGIPQTTSKHLEERLVLVNTGQGHLSSDIHNLVFGPDNYEKNIPKLDRMKEIAYEMAENIDDERRMGELIRETWKLQRSLHESIESKRMRELQEVGEGLYLGCRATGAGGGGCMIFYTSPDKKEELINTLGKVEGAKIIPFEFDYEGMRIEKSKE